jgi:predicted CoA-substrate-specific enzyme activase
MNENGVYFGGCDVGSTTGKAVLIDSKGRIAASSLVPSEIDPEITAGIVLQRAIDSLNDLTAVENLKYLVGTGYGRNEVPFANENISEISCHAMGVHHVDSRVRTIVDIGGQDVKGISLNGNGSVQEFAMNDKCAAGTGRFYEAMSRVFRMELDESSNLALKAKNEVSVTSQCSVFAESEVISLLAKKISPEDIAAGIQASVAKRCFTLLKRVGINKEVTLSGGCAKNKGLMNALEKKLKIKIVQLEVDPQLMGALGAAVIARQKAG